MIEIGAILFVLFIVWRIGRGGGLLGKTLKKNKNKKRR